MLKAGVHALFRAIGYDVVRYANNPARTWLGLATRAVRTVIDVGANEGQFARHASRHFPQATYYCFEPLPPAFAVLSEWAACRPSGTTHLFNVALGEAKQIARMHVHDSHAASSSLLETTEVTEALYPFTREQTPLQVCVRTLDDAMSDFLDKMDDEVLLKLDVQGYEDRVLSGASNTLSRTQFIILEVGLDLLYKGQAEFGSLVSMLAGAGFQYAGNLEQTYASDGHVVFVDAVFQRRTRPT